MRLIWRLFDPVAPIPFRAIKRRVRAFQFGGGTNGGEDGGASAFNDAGHVVFVAHFTDDTSAIFTAVVPEPASAAWVACCAAALLARRQRRAALPRARMATCK